MTNNTKSCIDHIFIRNIDIFNTQTFILNCKITDHYVTKNNQLKDVHYKINTNKLTKFIDTEH